MTQPNPALSAKLDEIADYALGFIPESGIVDDWDNLYDRIERVFDIDLGNSLLSPEIKAIRKAIRKAIKERE